MFFLTWESKYYGLNQGSPYLPPPLNAVPSHLGWPPPSPPPPPEPSGPRASLGLKQTFSSFWLGRQVLFETKRHFEFLYLKPKFFRFAFCCCCLIVKESPSSMWLAFLQGSLHSLFFGEPHLHRACFKCIKLRGRLILWRENPVFVQELDLCLLPQQSRPRQLHIWWRDLWN